MTRPPQLPEPVAHVDWFRRCPTGGGTTYRPSTEDTVTYDLSPLKYDLSTEDGRFDYARAYERGGAIHPTVDHLTLLKQTCWRMSDCEFGAAEIDGKRPYGNSDVEDDLAELLPHLPPEARLRVHCELPGVLAWMCSNDNVLQKVAEEARRA
jgi:hypothetical protein